MFKKKARGIKIILLALAAILTCGVLTALPVFAVWPPLEAPGNLKAIWGADVVKLTWTATSTNIQQYEVERKEGSGNWLQIKTLSNNVTSYADAEVIRSNDYYYRVRSGYGSIYSPYSNEARATSIIYAEITQSPITITKIPEMTVAEPLKILKRPAITVQPDECYNAMENGEVTLKITADGTEPLAYKWQFGFDGTTWTPIPPGQAGVSGEETPELKLTNIQLALNGRYFRCVVSSPYGTAYSNKTFLLVSFTISSGYNPDTDGLPSQEPKTPGKNEFITPKPRPTPTPTPGTAGPESAEPGDYMPGGYILYEPMPPATPAPGQRPIKTPRPAASPISPQPKQPGAKDFSTAKPGAKDLPAAQPGIVLNKTDHFAFMNGVGNGLFDPYGNITRAQAVVIFSRLLSSPVMDPNANYGSGYYSDVDPETWYGASVNFMHSIGVLEDFSQGGAFRPNDAITRAEFAVLASHMEEMEDIATLNVYEDVMEGHWAAKYIASVSVKGWMLGYPDGTFMPDALIKRMEAVVIVCRMLERMPDMDYLAANADSLPQKFDDVPPDLWAYAYIMEASISHEYVKSGGSEYWTAVY